MNWYIAKIIFGIKAGHNQHKAQFDEQIRLIQADGQEEAFLKARMIGLSEEDSFINDKNNLVKWEFINVAELLPVENLEDGVELYSRIYEMEEGDAFINFIHQKAVSLRLTVESLN